MLLSARKPPHTHTARSRGSCTVTLVAEHSEPGVTLVSEHSEPGLIPSHERYST